MEARRAQLMRDNVHWMEPVAVASTRPTTRRFTPQDGTFAPQLQAGASGDEHQLGKPISLSSPIRIFPEPPTMEASTSRRLTLDIDPTKPIPVTTYGWTFDGLISKGNRFKPVPRVSALASVRELEEVVKNHEQSGIPLVIENWHERPEWRKDIFNVDWLLEHHGNDIFPVRNVHNRNDTTIMLKDFIQKSRTMLPCITPGENERLYGKDADCPSDWRDWLDSDIFPSELLPNGSNNLLQHSDEVEHLMCYLGIGDTFTPCHKDLCASSGHNVMCYTENDGCSYWFMTASSDAPDVAKYFQDVLGQELDWENHVASVEEFAQAPFDVYVVEQKLGDFVLVPPRSCHQVMNFGGLTVKISWSRMTIAGLSIALHHELPIYRRVCRAEKYRIRSTIYRSLLYLTKELEETLENSLDLHEPSPSIPVRRSLRGNLVDYASSTCSEESSLRPSPLHDMPSVPHAGSQEQAIKLGALVKLFDEILCEEYSPDHQKLRRVASNSNASWHIFSGRGKNHPSIILQPPAAESKDDEDEEGGCGFYGCDFCGADIFQSCFECRKCICNPDSEEERLLICAACYVEGRTCRCESMMPVQSRSFETLLQDRNKAVEVLLRGSDSKMWVGDWECSELTESTVAQGDDIPIFEAACILHDLRQTARSKVSHVRSAQSDTYRWVCLSGNRNTQMPSYKAS
ncbi:hypothetical protein BKA93DRAFT_812084 [Sparassis latifolia]